MLHFATQAGCPKASVLQMYGMLAQFEIKEASGDGHPQHPFERWADPIDDAQRRRRGIAAYEDVHGTPPPEPATTFQGRARLDYLYGEIWSRDTYLTRRARRLVSICAAASDAVDDEVTGQVQAALSRGDLTRAELEELVVPHRQGRHRVTPGEPASPTRDASTIPTRARNAWWREPAAFPHRAWP